MYRAIRQILRRSPDAVKAAPARAAVFTARSRVGADRVPARAGISGERLGAPSIRRRPAPSG